MFYSTHAVSVVSEATKDGSTVLSYFSDPVSGQHADPGTAVDVAAATDQLLVRSLWISGFIHCRDHFGHLKIAAFMGLSGVLCVHACVCVCVGGGGDACVCVGGGCMCVCVGGGVHVCVCVGGGVHVCV